MKLDTNKKVMLCTKALYAEQLKCYASLCECYQELAKHAGRNATASDVQRKYSAYLTLASKGDLRFTEKENNFVFSEGYQGARFQSSEIKLFREYAKQSQRLQQFKNGAAILADALCQDGPPYEDSLDEYKKYMKRTSPATKSFDKEISEHSPTYIGHSYYVKSRDAIRSIQSIDSSHLDGITIPMKLAPSQFGANISGVTTITKLMEDTRHEARYVDTKDERIEYSKKPSPIKEYGYRFCAKNQRGVALSLAAIMALGLTAGTVSQVKTSAQYNSLSLENLEAKGLETDLSQVTLDQIKNLEELIETAQNQSTIPTQGQLYEIGETIDELYDDILQEKLSASFAESHPGSTNITVDHSYNYYDQNEPYKGITISYLDAEGQTQEEHITHFSSVGFFSPNDVSDVFDQEYATDVSYKDIDAIFSVSNSKNYIDNSKDVKGLLGQYSHSLSFIKHLAAVKLDYKDGKLFGIIPPSVESTFPDQKNTESHDDEER